LNFLWASGLATHQFSADLASFVDLAQTTERGELIVGDRPPQKMVDLKVRRSPR
jgi:hypothetical protein